MQLIGDWITQNLNNKTVRIVISTQRRVGVFKTSEARIVKRKIKVKIDGDSAQEGNTRAVEFSAIASHTYFSGQGGELCRQVGASLHD